MKKKEVWTIEKSLLEDEKRLRERAQIILLAKKVQIPQKTIDIMVADFAIMKGYYDDLKKRYEAIGK